MQKNALQFLKKTICLLGAKASPCLTYSLRSEIQRIIRMLNFNPNKTPREILQEGSFGGTYFRPIILPLLKINIKTNGKKFTKDLFEGSDIDIHVASSIYRNEINKCGVAYGSSLKVWEANGWINMQDIYGWFQRYCRYFLSGRTSDDKRQMKRWNNFKVRIKKKLYK